MFERVGSCTTAAQPKQVAVSENQRLVFVSCMEGRCVQVFDLKDLHQVKILHFEEPCVEVLVDGNLLFVTTTNFGRAIKKNKMYIIDASSLEILGSADPEGNWCKIIAISPDGQVLLVSNWHSHDISVISIADARNPRLLQRIPCGESPRGLAFVDSGKALAACFYSGTVAELTRDKGGRFKVSHETRTFRFPIYSGNPRDVVIDPSNGNIAWISNMGRNMVQRYNVAKRSIEKSILVGREPNSIRFMKSDPRILLVSCRASNGVVALNTETGELIGKSALTGSFPTGLECTKEGFLVTGFDSNSLELYTPTKQD